MTARQREVRDRFPWRRRLLLTSRAPGRRGWRTELTPDEITSIESAMERVPVLREHYIDAGSSMYEYK